MMKLTSSAFTDGGIIPSRYTCEGMNLNPPLHIDQVPKGTKSLVLIVEDPDVPPFIRSDRMFDHWVLFNLPPTLQQINEHTSPPGIQGKNTSGKNGYYGPCPPDREHRYFFKLYALDVLLDLQTGASKTAVQAAMKHNIIAECQLMGRYEKGKGY